MSAARPVVLAFSLLLLPGLAGAAGVETELDRIQKKMERERQGITKIRKQEGPILQGLEKIELALDRKNQELQRISARLEILAADLQKKEAALETSNSTLKARRELLKRRARALYKWQVGGSPFILLSAGSSVAEMMQRKRYLELTLAYDQQLVQSLREENAHREALKRAMAERREDLDRQRRGLLAVKEAIRLEREKKREMLAGLQRERETHVRALKELEQAAARLQKMMDEISRKSAGPALPAGADFETMKGKLEFPVRGEVLKGFGKTKLPEFSAELFRKGIDIEAPLGEEIRAVERGKVVFADRFAGYGKMMIIDHGQRYYTVYAHLAQLLKRTGEPVQRGEPIALLGDSDSLAGARLYFEIRKDGKPLDPLQWFRRR